MKRSIFLEPLRCTIMVVVSHRGSGFSVEVSGTIYTSPGTKKHKPKGIQCLLFGLQTSGHILSHSSFRRAQRNYSRRRPTHVQSRTHTVAD